jgi:streptothricin acetyltransferase
VERYTKRYRVDPETFDAQDDSRSMIAVAREGCQVAGYIVASRAWNNCAQIDAFAVDRAYRRQGLGRRLMDEAVCWTREQGLRVVRLETQTNNIPGCRFYERYGFKLGGFDRHLYDEIPAHPGRETALFWYCSIGEIGK